jgi:hypothetical protein
MIMNIAILSNYRGVRTAVVSLCLAFALIFTAGISSEAFAQREGESFRIVANDTVMGLVPGQTLRMTVFNPSLVGAGGHVKVFSGTGQILLSAQNTYIGAGEFRSFDINYTDLEQMEGEPGTGRRQIRTDLTISFSGLESDARRFHPSFELFDTARGTTILIGMLLPAVQKVR